MHFLRLITFAAVATLPLNFALAQSSCSELVVDQAHVISDVGKVEAAAKSLGNQGATVRVRTFANVPKDELGKEVNQLRDSCPSWHVGNHFASTMLVLAYTPDGHQVSARFGSSIEPRLGSGVWNKILADRLVPQIKASARGDKGAITVGMVDTLHEMQATLARPSAGGGAVTVNQASDLSGLWKVLGWFVAIAAIVIIALIIWLVWGRSSDSKEQHDSARSLARRARSRAVSGLLDITNDATLAMATAQILAQPAEKQAGLNIKLERVKALGSQGLATLSEFDSTSDEDPNVTSMSVDAYQSNQKRYEEIIREYVQPAKHLLSQIEIGDSTGTGTISRDPSPTPTPPSNTHFLPDPPVSRDQPRSGHFLPDEPTTRQEPQARSPWSPPPQPQVVERVVEHDSGIGNILTGLVIGDMLSHNRDGDSRREGRRERHESDTGSREYGGSEPVREEPRDDGGSFSVSADEPEDSGGSFAVDTSSSDDSDSGGSVAADDSSSSDNNA